MTSNAKLQPAQKNTYIENLYIAIFMSFLNL